MDAIAFLNKVYSDRLTLNLDSTPIISTRNLSLKDILERCKTFNLQAPRSPAAKMPPGVNVTFGPLTKAPQPIVSNNDAMIPSLSITPKTNVPGIDIGRNEKVSIDHVATASVSTPGTSVNTTVGLSETLPTATVLTANTGTDVSEPIIN
jgi:hypothetical protein